MAGVQDPRGVVHHRGQQVPGPRDQCRIDKMGSGPLTADLHQVGAVVEPETGGTLGVDGDRATSVTEDLGDPAHRNSGVRHRGNTLTRAAQVLDGGVGVMGHGSQT